jgi:RNA polymerase sigma factor (sigma-70 family)
MSADTDGPSPNDSHLIRVLAEEATAEEKRDACARLWERYGDRMEDWATACLRVRGVHNLEALDVVQEVFARLISLGLPGHFQAGRPLWPYLRQAVRNKLRDLLRRERRHRRRQSADHLSAPARERPPPELLIAREEYAGALEQLPAEERVLFQAFYLEGKSPADLAAERQTNVSWVYRQLHKARVRIRRFLEARDRV